MNPAFFIVGCPRSGTTLLGRMADAHPDLAAIHEGRFVPDWYQRRRGLALDRTVTPRLNDELCDYRPFEHVLAAPFRVAVCVTHGLLHTAVLRVKRRTPAKQAGGHRFRFSHEQAKFEEGQLGGAEA